jgi:predicted anti-sigma-YlaC factor YlaD
MYSAYKSGSVDLETKLWMEQHRKECSYCRAWSISVDENREDKSEDNENINANQKDSKAHRLLEKLKVTLVIGLSFIVFAGIYLFKFLES